MLPYQFEAHKKKKGLHIDLEDVHKKKQRVFDFVMIGVINLVICHQRISIAPFRAMWQLAALPAH